MFQYGDNEINSYNSLSMSQTNKAEIKPSKLFSSSKILITNDFSSKIKKNQNSNKKIIVDINNANDNNLNKEKGENNHNENNKNKNSNNKLEEIDLNEKTNSSKNLTKLPKINKYAIQTNSILESSSNINPLISITNSIDKTINGNQNLYYTKNQQFYNDHLKNKNASKKRKNSLRLSGTANYASLNQKRMKHSDNNNKKNKNQNEPKLGKMKEYIKLPDFIGDEPLTEMIFNPILQDNLSKPQNEKQYEINLYLNSHKMLNKLIYLKIPLTKEGLIPTQNIINVKKLNKENKFDDDDEEEIIPENKKEINEKNNKQNVQENEENNQIIILPKSKPYVSISEYPGNYKPIKKIINERELKLSQNFLNKLNNNENLDKNIVKSTRASMNLNLYEICKRYQNNSELYAEKNSDNYVSKSIHIQNGLNFFENKTDKNNNSIIINNNINAIENENTNEQTIQLNTIYGDIQPYYKLKNEKDTTLIFESRFESGNLLCAFKTEEENNYQLYLQNDTNTTGYIQWFFFRVSNTKKGKKAIFNIINMLRPTCVYKKGLKIMTYSKLQAKNENIGWHRDCQNIMYYTNNLFTYNENSKKRRSLSSLCFEYEFKYDHDTVYFANCLPYFYSKLTKEIKFYENKTKNKFYFFEKNSITQTLGGNELFSIKIDTSKSQNIINPQNSFPHLIQSNNQPLPNLLNSSFNLKKSEIENNQQKSQNSKKAVIMIARQHPGETVGSFVIKGCIDFLLGDSEEAKKLRDIYNFYILPMMNPDGVLVGNSRTSFAGCDLNRRWSKPNEIIHPEIFYAKSLILQKALKQNISFIIDFHGHFGTYNSLFYCNHKENKETCALFPYLCSKLSNIISFQQSTFSMPKYKNSTERLSLFRELENNNNNNIVALETSFFGTRKDNEKNYYFNSKLLSDIGRDVCLGMLSYYIKCEKISIENNFNFFTDIEKMKKLDVDMREFEAELIKEVNEDEDLNGEEELSESEPSIDNFDKKEIMKLMPVYQKKKKKKGKNMNFNNYNINRIKKLEKYLVKRKNGLEKNNFDKNKNKNIDIDIELYNPLKELLVKKVEEENKKKIKINKNPPIKSSSITSANFKMPKTIQTQNIQNQSQPPPLSPTEPNFKSDYTQTEEIFFRMHWTFFVGKYKILTGKKKNNNNNLPNISALPINMGKMNNNYINPFSHSTIKRNDLLVNAKYKNTNWTKFGNIFVDERNINHIRKPSGNNNIKLLKNNIEENNRNYSIRDRSNIKPIYLTRFNGNSLPLSRKENNENKINKGSVNKEKIIFDKNGGNKGKNGEEEKKREDNKKENDNIHP